MNKIFLTICFLAVMCLSGCSAMFGRPGQLSTSRATEGPPPERGLRVEEVFPDSPAAAAGIQSMDLITQYGDHPIVDDAGYFAARNQYENTFAPTVEIAVWRGVHRMTAKVSTGWLGVKTRANDKVSEAFLGMMNRINSMREIPDYMHNREFKGQFDGGPAKVLEQAKILIDKAESEGTLTPAQIQVARIFMILDDAPEEDQRRLAELLKEFIATQPVNYIHMLGNDVFFEKRRYRAAVACFNHYLKTSPNDISMRLTMAVAYNHLGMYEEAEGAANYVFDHNLELSNHGHVVAYMAKAYAALGRKDYGRCIQFYDKAWAIEKEPIAMMFSAFAAAQMGDTEKVELAIQKYKKALPVRYHEMKLHLDAVQAYALVKSNQPDAARKIVKEWKDTEQTEGRLIGLWRFHPDGLVVARNWADLMQN